MLIVVRAKSPPPNADRYGRNPLPHSIRSCPEIARTVKVTPQSLSRRAPLDPVPRGRQIELTLERTIERGLGFVTGMQRNLKDGVIGGLEQPRAELHAAARDVGERRLAEQPRKPFRKYG